MSRAEREAHGRSGRDDDVVSEIRDDEDGSDRRESSRIVANRREKSLTMRVM